MARPLTKSLIKLLPAGTVKGDGGNLWIVSSKAGTKRWEFRYTYAGKRRCMGLGPWPEVSVEDARDKALANRKLLIDGIDPLAEKQARAPRRMKTFAEVAEDAIESFAKAWTGPKQKPQWRSSLERYAYPVLGKMNVASITVEDVQDVLEPIWVAKGPTAERVQNRIERILDYATVKKHRSGDNPARIKGNLEHLLSDSCVAAYLHTLDEDGQVAFKGSAKAFTRTYAFLSAVLPFSSPDWEKLSIFLDFLIPKLPAPRDEDLSKGILEAIDMDSYRVEKQSIQRLRLADEDHEIDPVPLESGGQKPEPELERLSSIIRSFNDLFGNIDWADADRIRKLISEDIPRRVAANEAYQNAQMNSDKQNARIELDKALRSVIVGLMKDDTQLFKQFSDNKDFQRWLSDTVFAATYKRAGSGPDAGRDIRL